jgi:hypothetical protein
MRPPKIIEKGEVRLVPLSELDLPTRSSTPEASLHRETVKERVVEMAWRGYVLAGEDEVRRPTLHGHPSIDAYDESAPLSFTPANFRHGVLLARDIGGDSGDPPTTGMTRIYDVPRTAFVVLHENDYLTGRALVTMARESVNSTVRDWPASLQVLFAPSGNCRCSLMWWTPRMLYFLQTWTEGFTPESASKLIADYALKITR